MLKLVGTGECFTPEYQPKQNGKNTTPEIYRIEEMISYMKEEKCITIGPGAFYWTQEYH